MIPYEVDSIFHVVNNIGNEYLMKIKWINYSVGKGSQIKQVNYDVIWSGVPSMGNHPQWGKVFPSYEESIIEHKKLEKRLRLDAGRVISPLDVKRVPRSPFDNELFEV